MAGEKKNKAPAFQFYVKDYLTDHDVVLMTLEQQGAYVRLLCHQWLEGSIPADQEILARLLTVSRSRMKVIWAGIGMKFRDAGDGRLANERLTRSKEGHDEWVAKSAAGGVRSARLRQARQKGTHTSVEWANLVAAMNGKCPRCGNECDDFQKDHVVPIYQGGSDAIDNIQPLCRKCNSSKGPDRTDHVAWLRTGPTVVAPPLLPNSNTASASPSAPASSLKEILIDWENVAALDVENFVSLAIQTANGGMIAAGIDFNPIMGNHRSRQNVFDWIEAGISRRTILETVHETARGAAKQISSMKYFNNAVTNAHEKGRAVVIPEGSQAHEVMQKGVQANYPKSNEPRNGDPLAEKEKADRLRVDEWKAAHDAEAELIWNEVRAEMIDKGMDALGAKHLARSIEAHFRKRILDEHLTPKAVA